MTNTILKTHSERDREKEQMRKIRNYIAYFFMTIAGALILIELIN